MYGYERKIDVYYSAKTKVGLSGLAHQVSKCYGRKHLLLGRDASFQAKISVGLAGRGNTQVDTVGGGGVATSLPWC
jgi:hypothetical protein